MAETNSLEQLVGSCHPITTDPFFFASDYEPELFSTVRVSYGSSKRALDISLSLLTLVVGSPLFLLIAALVKLTSRGPVIFKQTRVGQRGDTFTCYKFRSMCSDAEMKRQELLHRNEASGPVFKIKDDPRITSIGRFLRKFSLDELPQFYNVLKGDMSVVGARPPLPCEVEYYGPREWHRLTVKPGITCIWQVSGRSDVTFDEWMELDHLYIRNMSLREDIRIIIQTAPAVIRARGAR